MEQAKQISSIEHWPQVTAKVTAFQTFLDQLLGIFQVVPLVIQNRQAQEEQTIRWMIDLSPPFSFLHAFPENFCPLLQVPLDPVGYRQALHGPDHRSYFTTGPRLRQCLFAGFHGLYEISLLSECHT